MKKEMKKEMRLIDANALLESIEGTDWYTIRVDGSATQGAPSEEVAWYKATDIYAAVENAPSVDAVEVVHGRWRKVYDDSAGWVDMCNICKDFGDGTPYCPNCGAKMDKNENP